METQLPKNKRFETMAALYRSGQTLREIGSQFNCSHQYIRQCLRKIKISPSAMRQAQSLKKSGCSLDQFVELHKMKAPTDAFYQQRSAAKKRGISWELNLWQWWTIWEQSGHWEDRGRGGDCYCMCRTGDVGPYAVDNVYIATIRQNCSDASRFRRIARGTAILGKHSGRVSQ